MADQISAETTQKLRPSREESKCSKEGCKRPYRAKGYCNVHYKAWRRGELEGHRARYRICTKEGCRKPRAIQGSLCEEHLQAAKGEAAAS
ncbi:MAG TPA: hypothetical protein VH877_31805 [Polyangia bacterium]|nr:hypothetical protein [Polyangia bacterium]